MNVTVGTSQVQLDTSAYVDLQDRGQTLILQNLGSGDLYFDFLTGVTSSKGIKVAANGSYEMPNYRGQAIYLIASAASTDVRFAVFD